MPNWPAMSAHLQRRLESEGMPVASAVQAAKWLDEAGLLPDNPSRPGLPLRKRLRNLKRAGQLDLISGAYQDPPQPNGRWWIRRVHGEQRRQPESKVPFPHSPAVQTADTSHNPIVTAEDARVAEFTGFVTVGECINIGLPNDTSLNQCGVYLVCDLSESEPVFIPPAVAREMGNVVKPWSVRRLEVKWVDAVEVLYIGLAGARSYRSLRKRLRDLVRHARGDTTDRGPHKGGEILWQLRDYEQLVVCWRPTGMPPAPRELERTLLASFESSVGRLPFANRQR